MEDQKLNWSQEGERRSKSDDECSNKEKKLFVPKNENYTKTKAYYYSGFCRVSLFLLFAFGRKTQPREYSACAYMMRMRRLEGKAHGKKQDGGRRGEGTAKIEGK